MAAAFRGGRYPGGDPPPPDDESIRGRKGARRIPRASPDHLLDRRAARLASVRLKLSADLLRASPEVQQLGQGPRQQLVEPGRIEISPGATWNPQPSPCTRAAF